MKKTILNLLFLVTVAIANAQYVPAEDSNPKSKTLSTPGKTLYPIYLGLGTGVYGKYGIVGLSGAVRLSPQTLAELNLGYGFWGTKMGVSLTTFAKDKNAWCPSIGFSRNTGFENVQLTSLITYKGGSSEMEYTGLHTFEPVNILHLGVQRQWLSARGNRILLELGYSLALNTPTVVLETTGIMFNNQFIPVSDITFSDTQQSIYDIMAPNGLMVSFAYQFGMGNYNNKE